MNCDSLDKNVVLYLCLIGPEKRTGKKMRDRMEYEPESHIRNEKKANQALHSYG